ncbi:MAG: hypothetical protein HYX78_07590 [Armatimonadetes bacterium]|nr:hypothetical protein [Armatimonadota bacterium]
MRNASIIRTIVALTSLLLVTGVLKLAATDLRNAEEKADAQRFDVDLKEFMQPLDLTARARRALEGFMSQAPRRIPGPEGYYRAVFDSKLWPKAKRAHAQWDLGDCTARAVLAWTWLREMTGDKTTGLEVEQGQRKFLLSLLHPETGLVYIPDLSDTEKGIYRYHTWDQGQTLRALVRWYEVSAKDRSLLRPRIDRMIRGLDRFATIRGEDPTWGAYAGWPSDDFENDKPGKPYPDSYFCYNRAGVAIEPLMMYVELTDDRKALDLAICFANCEMGGHQGDIVESENVKSYFRFGSEGSFVGHYHSKTATLIGVVKLSRYLAAHGRLEESRRYLNRVGQIYKWMFSKDNPGRASLVGWGPERIGLGLLSDDTETCCTADMIELAEAMASCADLAPDFRHWVNLHDDVEAMTVNTIARSQILITPRLLEFLARQYKGDVEEQLGTARRFDGAWPASHIPEDLVRTNEQGNLELDLAACCHYAGVRGLYSGWRDAIHSTNGQVRINYFINRASPHVEMKTRLPVSGQSEIKLRRDARVFVRVPTCLKPKEMSFTVAGREISAEDHLDKAGQYVALGSVAKGDIIEVSFPVKERVTKERVKTRHPETFTVHWRGNYVVKVSPSGNHFPYFP